MCVRRVKFANVSKAQEPSLLDLERMKTVESTTNVYVAQVCV